MNTRITNMFEGISEISTNIQESFEENKIPDELLRKSYVLSVCNSSVDYLDNDTKQYLIENE